MNICPCIDTIYKGVDLTTALNEIKSLGYRGFEFWHTEGKDLELMKSLMDSLELSLVNFDAREVPLTQPERRKDFIEGVEEAMALAKELRSSHVTVLSGDDTGQSRQVQHESVVAGLKAAAHLAEANGVTIVIEASNSRVNRPHNYLTGADEAFQIIDEVGSPAVRMLYDIYHQQISEGDLLSRIIPNIEKIGHFHAAGVPNRHELDECEINYDFVLRRIAETSYDQWAGLEYFPAREPYDGLNRLKAYFEL